MGNFTVKNFTFKLILSLPLLLLLWHTFVNVYYWCFDLSFVIQVSLALLWGVEVWWILKNGTMPLSVFLVSAFIVIYLGFAVDNPPKLSAYLSDVLWAMLYTYVLKEEYLRSLKENITSTREVSFSNEA